jgi:hypothetical protein
MRSSASAVLSRHAGAEALRLGAQAIGLASFGVLLETACGALARAIPREIYGEPSFTAALIAARPAFALPFALALFLLAASFMPNGRRRLGWPRVDGVGGIRWVALGIMLTLAWPYGAYPYNHYWDQAHLLDRGLVFLFLLLTLRSPVWLPFFLLQIVISRVQTFHPVSMRTPILDEVPFRILGIIAGFGLWNLIAAPLGSLRERAGWLRFARPLEVRALVLATLCLFGAYYLYAGVGKVMLGERPLDWVIESHMDNLFIGAFLNGWNASLSEATALELARWVRAFSIPIAATSLALELGMLFVLASRRLTLGILAGIIAMHLGIVAVTGVFFWTWALVAACMLAWLLRWWRSEELLRLYTPANAVLSVVLTASFALAFGWDPFSWWNSKWTTHLELDAVDAEGHVYRLDYADFSPYLLISFWKPYESSIPGWYGGTPFQAVLRQLEAIDPAALKARNDARWAAGRGPTQRDPALDEFIQRFFTNRNRNLGRKLLWLPPPPTLRMRSPRDGTQYRDQAPVAEVRVRYVEAFYTGSSIVPLRDTILHTILIPGGP